MAESDNMKGKVLPLSKRNLIKIKVNGVEKRYKPSRHYVFILQVRWSDMSEYVIYRKYSDFYTLQCGLVDKFPIEAGAIRESDRTLPYLPGRLLFSRTEVSKVAFQRKSDLAKYCSSLLELDPKISQCAEVINFFEATFEDINPPKDATKKPDHSKLILALLPFLKKKSKDSKQSQRERSPPMRRAKSTTAINIKLAEKKAGADEDYSVDDMTITGPITLETYAVIADYKAGDKSEVSLKEGDHLEVFEKNNNGWWFVQSESGQGWAPASYLEPVSHPIEIDEPDPTYKGNLEKFITTESYTAQFSDEISFDQDVILEVMHKLLDGWWIVSYQGDAGYAPAAYLEPYNNPHFLRSSTVKRPTIKPIPRRCTIKSKSKAWKKKTEKDLTLYRQYSRKRKSTQKAPVVSVPPKPPRIIEEEEEAATSLYINTQAKKAITQAIEEEPSYLEVEENADAIYENITETKETESELPAPVPPPRPGFLQQPLHALRFSLSAENIYDDIENVLPPPREEVKTNEASTIVHDSDNKSNEPNGLDVKPPQKYKPQRPELPKSIAKKIENNSIISELQKSIEQKPTGNFMDAHRKNLNATLNARSAMPAGDSRENAKAKSSENTRPKISSKPVQALKHKVGSSKRAEHPKVPPKPTAKGTIASRVAMFEK